MLKRAGFITTIAIAMSVLAASTATAYVEVRDPNNGYELCPEFEVTGTGPGAVTGGCEIDLANDGPVFFKNTSASGWYGGITCNVEAVVRIESDGDFAIDDWSTTPGEHGCGYLQPDLPGEGYIEYFELEGVFKAQVEDIDFGMGWGPGQLDFNLTEASTDVWHWTADDDMLFVYGSETRSVDAHLIPWGANTEVHIANVE